MSYYNLGQKFVNKFPKLIKIDFSMKWLVSRDFPAQISKFVFWVADWVFAIESKHFRNFCEIHLSLRS